DTKAADTNKAPDAKTADTKAADAKPAAKAEPARKDAAAKDEIAQLAESAQARAAAAAATKAGEPRYLLQVGAYAGQAGADAAVERVGALGLRAFTEKIKTDAGDRIRVRVGPFPSRDAADQARAKLQAAGVQAALIAPPSTPSR
ncbi:MAG: SPOR domain-containing protein, partial [Burkholderiales bacterium]